MAVWKKLNPETGEYETIDNSDSGNSSGIVPKNTIGVTDAYTTYSMADVADSVSVGTTMTTYTVTGLLAGDTVKLKRQYNGQSGSLRDGDGNDLSSRVKWSNYVYGTFVLDKDYAKLVVNNHTGYEDEAKVIKRTANMMSRPSLNNEFVPTIADSEKSTLKTLSSRQIRADYGMDVLKARENLSGGVWIALGDSYTVYAGGAFKALAAKYGMIYDGQGKVSSTVCGDNTGNKGFSPFHSRMNGFIANYTGSGQTINDVVYAAEDVKLITFMGGANDGFGRDTWLGSRTSMDTNYIYGACNYIFRKLHENFPNARIICILQPANYSDSMNYTDDATAQTIGFKDLAEMQTWEVYSFGQYKMETKERAVKECAERFGIPIVDCIFDWYSVVNPTQRAKYWNADKIHLSGEGTAALAEKLERDGILKVFG